MLLGSQRHARGRPVREVYIFDVASKQADAKVWRYSTRMEQITFDLVVRGTRHCTVPQDTWESLPQAWWVKPVETVC